jgi:antitoxin ParD1/3/4
MPTRNIVLTNHQTQFVEQLVSSGRYQNASEVLREGLRLIQQREKEQATHLQALREAITVGIEDIENGRYTALDGASSVREHVMAIRRKVASSQ